jgi:RNA polymerase sigma factor (TIGR02999 family)
MPRQVHRFKICLRRIGASFLTGQEILIGALFLTYARRTFSHLLLRVLRSRINLFYMGDVTRILEQIEGGDKVASERLFPLVYAELRRLAGDQMHRERPGQTLQATALVNEAYIRLVDVKLRQNWNSRSHFFGAAAEAMRRILIERARHRRREKRGGDWKRVDFENLDPACSVTPDQLVALDDALARLTELDAIAGQLVSLRYFAGMSLADAAGVAGVSTATAYRHWAYARAWLSCELMKDA